MVINNNISRSCFSETLKIAILGRNLKSPHESKSMRDYKLSFSILFFTHNKIRDETVNRYIDLSLPVFLGTGIDTLIMSGREPILK